MIDFQELNVFAVIAGGILYMLFGALYYSPVVFGKTWTVLNGARMSEYSDALKYGMSAVTAFATSFLVAVIMAASGADTVTEGLTIGVMLSVLLSLAYLKNMLFGLMPKKAYSIAVGDHVVMFILLSVLHAVWK
ncbi:DUF1761 domain-containing protein [Fictibacillus iocasae]|uniref:DUF1761 domain-containing protein n=1 Tax=Fictibacillus iocasae TaxID=2715437 RepID=A0ABW2NRR0_9BACL